MRVLELVSRPGSIDYRVLRGLRRDDVLAYPSVLERFPAKEDAPWWLVVAAS